MTKKMLISEIFNGTGIPKETYVSQEKGLYERQLEQGILEKGTLCLLTGSSKTGKTTLYNNVLKSHDLVPLIVRCNETVDADEFWKRPLETVDFRRIKNIQRSEEVEINTSAKIGGTIGWKWLAGLIGEVSLGLKGTKTETEIREAIVSKPSPSHLIPLLNNSNAVLVVEDFHYLTEDTQRHIFQQWKSFTDEGVSVIVVGTTHHGVDLAYANPDLIGRIQQIELKRWNEVDLKQIAEKGFSILKIEMPVQAVNTIAKESVGLPIIAQQAYAQLFVDKGCQKVQVGEELTFTKKCSFHALHMIATNRYKQFEAWYTRLTTGPRKVARKYNTYELILSAFALDPPKFVLKRHEIDERIASMPISSDEKPPAASVNSTLSAVGKFQKTNGFELLEWSKRDQAIYVLEPAFLFYLRWRTKKDALPNPIETFRMILKLFNINATE
ncbi:AAA family ATPase [Vreelandella boliviensis]|uniref:AAA family ATPase n=1 Tax=Vreelandella boliviensis TaxID=223527 RepID=UPI001B8C34F4|nr:AAA family ATPase [Halomonas boliviensis]MBS3669240.1 AAA family ATPase [Halomonas boliviensis]